MSVYDEVLDRVPLPDGREMTLVRWDEHVAIRVGDRPLMSSHDRGSEIALGELVTVEIADVPAPEVLIGGLGLGFTLRATLDGLAPDAHVVVAELLPAVVGWNRGAYGSFAGRPLDDPRVEVIVGDVGDVIAKHPGRFDAVVLDVDNGPDALVHPDNAKLYKRKGLELARAALRGPGGLLAVWSAFPSKTFTRWLIDVGFDVTIERAASTDPRAPRYYIWMGRRT